MDVTPQLLKDVDFREKKFGGYDPDEVDDFLERVGVAIGQLQLRLREMTHRAEAAEARLAEVPAAPVAPVETDDTLRRTLLLAQRTADAAVAEAQEEATRIVGAAQDEAARLRAEDQERHERQLQESQDEVRHSVDEIRERLLQEINELEAIRDQLMNDVEVLERHVDDERARLTTTVGTLQGLLDAAGSLAPLEPPVVSGVIPPIEPEPNFDAPDDSPSPETAFGAPEPAFGAPEPDAPVPTPPPVLEVSFDDGAQPAEPPPTEAPPVFDPLPPAPAFGEPAGEPGRPPETGSVWDAPAGDVFAAEPAGDADLFQQPPPPPPPPPGGGEPTGFGGLGSPGGPAEGDPWSALPGTGPATQATESIAGDNPWMADLARDEIANQPPPPPGDEDAMAEWYRQQEEAGGAAKSDKKRFGRGKK